MCSACWFSLLCLLSVKGEDVWESRASGEFSNHHNLTHNHHAVQGPDHHQESRDIPAAHQPAHGRCPQDCLLVFIGKKRLLGNTCLLEKKNIVWLISCSKKFSDSELPWTESTLHSLYILFLLLSLSDYP